VGGLRRDALCVGLQPDGKLIKTVPVGERVEAFGLDSVRRLYVYHGDMNRQEIMILDQSGKILRSIRIPE